MYASLTVLLPAKLITIRTRGKSRDGAQCEIGSLVFGVEFSEYLGQILIDAGDEEDARRTA